MKFGRKVFVVFVAAVMAVSACAFTGCNQTKPETETFQVELPEAKKYDAGTDVYPKPEGKTQKTLNYIKLNTVYPQTEWFEALALQGIVNRRDPSLYIVHANAVQSTGLPEAQYWLDALDVGYGGDAFEKVEYKKLSDLVVLYRDSVKGAVLYDSRIVGGEVTDANANSSIYGYVALLNLTSMMAAQLDALPLTKEALTALNAALKAAGKEELKVLGETESFLKKSGGGVYSRESRELWKNCYEYALGQSQKGLWKFSDRAIAHNGTFNACWYDYLISHKLFNYNRILQDEATAQEREIEDKILALTPGNTPVMGVWHLLGDENSLVTRVNEAGKFFCVTHESMNLSWTSGLPSEKLVEKSKPVVYDPTKVYVAMSLSEGDNNSYTNYKLPVTFDSIHDNYRNIVMTYPVQEAAYDLNPNIIRYLSSRAGTTDGFVTAESGIGYLNASLTSLEGKYDLGEFFGLTNLYQEKMHGSASGMRTYRNEAQANLKQVLYNDAADYVLSGYGADSPYQTNELVSGRNNYYFHDTPVFQAIGCNVEPSMLLGLSPAPGSMLYVGLSGWYSSVSQISSVVDRCPENFVFVTANQLADLYRQKMNETCQDVTAADFSADMTEDELQYLYYSDNFDNVNLAVIPGQKSYRTGQKDNYLVYRFRLDPGVGGAKFSFRMSGEYKISASTDLENWTTVSRYDIAEGDTSYGIEREVFAELPAGMAGKTVYLRISDPTPEDAVGYKFYGMNLVTDKASTSDSFRIEGGHDSAYYLSGGEKNRDGLRTGEAVYLLPFSDSVEEANVTVASKSAVQLEYSADGKTFYPLETVVLSRPGFENGNLYSAHIPSAVPSLKLRVKAAEPIFDIYVTPIRTTSGFSFSPSGNDFDAGHITTGWELVRRTAGMNAGVSFGNSGTLTYCFRLAEDFKNPTLGIYATGLFKLEISTDGKNFQTVKAVSEGESVTGKLSFNISLYARGGSLLYIRLAKNSQAGSNINCYSLSLSQN